MAVDDGGGGPKDAREVQGGVRNACSWKACMRLHCTGHGMGYDCEVHTVWFIRNTSKFPICLFLIFPKNPHMTVAYLLLNFLMILHMLFLKKISAVLPI